MKPPDDTEPAIAALMTSAFESRVQKDVQTVLGDLDACGAGPERQNVRVVVLPRQPGVGRVAAQHAVQCVAIGRDHSPRFVATHEARAGEDDRLQQIAARADVADQAQVRTTREALRTQRLHDVDRRCADRNEHRVHRRLRLGPTEMPLQLEAFLAGVHWLSLKELGQRPGLDPLLSLLTLPVLPKPDIPDATDQILQPRPDPVDTVVTILMERFPLFTFEEIMALINLPTDHLRHTRAAQDLLAEGEAVVILRLLNRRCGPVGEATTARILALPLQQLEALAEALLDFSGPEDLSAWLSQHAG